ncbi:GIY-YIG nuclease family protein [Parvicella tangerina]
MYFYIIYSAFVDRYYVGVTENLGQRLDYHNHIKRFKRLYKIIKRLGL